MKKFIKNNIGFIVYSILWVMLLLIPSMCLAAEPVDTLEFSCSRYEIVEDVTTNSKGAEVKKYYILADGYLIPTSKTTYEKIKLCKKYNAKCPLYAIISKKTKQIKRIIA